MIIHLKENTHWNIHHMQKANGKKSLCSFKAATYVKNRDEKRRNEQSDK